MHLSDPKVSRSLGDGYDDFDEYLLSILVADDLMMNALSEGGYDGSLLKIKIVLQEKVKLMEPHSKEQI